METKGDSYFPSARDCENEQAISWGQRARSGKEVVSLLSDTLRAVIRHCISFLLLLSQITTNFVILNNTNLTSSSSGDQDSKMSLREIKIKVFAGLVPSRGFRGDSTPWFSWIPEAASISWLLATSLQSLLLSSRSSPLSSCVPLLTTLVITSVPPR